MISHQDWNQEFNNVKVSKREMDDVIMNFLLIEGYKEPAVAFSKESGIQCKSLNSK